MSNEELDPMILYDKKALLEFLEIRGREGVDKIHHDGLDSQATEVDKITAGIIESPKDPALDGLVSRFIANRQANNKT